jgi:hypothetical protein
MDAVLDYMLKKKIVLTVEKYLELAYMGDISSLDEVGPEDRAEIEQLIEDGVLVDTKSNRVN